MPRGRDTTSYGRPRTEAPTSHWPWTIEPNALSLPRLGSARAPDGPAALFIERDGGGRDGPRPDRKDDIHGALLASLRLQAARRLDLAGAAGRETRETLPGLSLESRRRREPADRRLRGRSRRLRSDGAGRPHQDQERDRHDVGLPPL